MKQCISLIFSLLLLGVYTSSSEIHQLCKAGNYNDIRLFVHQNRHLVNQINYQGFFPLYIAIYNNKFSIAQFLLDNGAEVNSCNGRGYTNTPLYAAADKGNLPLVKSLLYKNANIDKGNSYGISPLCIALENGHHDVALYLIAQGANCFESNKKNGKKPIHIATQKGLIDIIEILLQKGVSIDACTENETNATPLVYAAIDGEYIIVKFLIEQGANVNVMCNSGLTPLDEALYRNNHAVAELLKSNGGKCRKDLINQSSSSLQNYSQSDLSKSKKISSKQYESNSRR